jgi:hypothetical protein
MSASESLAKNSEPRTISNFAAAAPAAMATAMGSGCASWLSNHLQETYAQIDSNISWFKHSF